MRGEGEGVTSTLRFVAPNPFFFNVQHCSCSGVEGPGLEVVAGWALIIACRISEARKILHVSVTSGASEAGRVGGPPAGERGREKGRGVWAGLGRCTCRGRGLAGPQEG
ncbi:hypothetical protein E2C01_029108 [Portunus trituberculatus]|uniref:Uncharacterized protein n=1 Tax=Portunus trituberculatus TaxID=210409 RepID=A0A5B7ERD6_PORTR|nr:hypothetical protein [Portunus trituberculatus]